MFMDIRDVTPMAERLSRRRSFRLPEQGVFGVAIEAGTGTMASSTSSWATVSWPPSAPPLHRRRLPQRGRRARELVARIETRSWHRPARRATPSAATSARRCAQNSIPAACDPRFAHRTAEQGIRLAAAGVGRSAAARAGIKAPAVALGPVHSRDARRTMRDLPLASLGSPRHGSGLPRRRRRAAGAGGRLPAGTAEVVSRHLVATVRAQEAQLDPGLDAFGDHAAPQAVRQRDDASVIAASSPSPGRSRMKERSIFTLLIGKRLR